MKKKLCILLVLILIPCTLFANEAISIADLITHVVGGLFADKDTHNTLERPARSEIADEYKWDLTPIYATEEDFYADIEKLHSITAQADEYRGIMDTSKENLLKVLTWIYDALELKDKISDYANLASIIDKTDEEATNRAAIAYQAAIEFLSAVYYIDTELLEAENIYEFMEGDPRFDVFRLGVDRTIIQKEHYLSEELEELLLRQGNYIRGTQEAYNTLVSSEMTFDDVFGQPLNAASYSVMICSPDRDIRREAYINYYKGFDKLKQTFAVLYDKSVQADVDLSRIRGYESSLDAALFGNNVDESIYFNLIQTIHEALPSLHRYYEVRRKALGVDKLAHYDVAISMVDDIEFNLPYEEAVDLIISALQPLGAEYTSIMKKGLTTDRWVDRYPQIGKSTGASSFITYFGNPVISMNYTGKSLTDVLDMIHEGGHSMHTKYMQKLPYPQFGYSVFHAEVASTLNEQLLLKYLVENSKTDKEKAFYLSTVLERFVSTVFRQTMFAEFELICHQLVEQGYTLTINTLRSIYRDLLETYFGPDVELLDLSDEEFIRVSHFYNAYYVYMYAIDYCASSALAQGIINGGEEELDAYLDYLTYGGTMFPIDALKKAGVDMSTQEPIKIAISEFDAILDEFEALQASLN